MADFGAVNRLSSLRDQAPSGLAGARFNPGEGCQHCCGELPIYGVAPHECYWRKGPEFVIGQSTLVPFTATDCFVPDLELHESWADFFYPQGCGIFYCPSCQRDKYESAWSALIARIGEPPEEVAACGHSHGEHQ